MAVTHSGSHEGDHVDNEGNAFGAAAHKAAKGGEHTHEEVDNWHNPWTDADEFHPHQESEETELVESGEVVDQQ